MFEPPTVIYVNADAGRRGRLILPLTVDGLRRSELAASAGFPDQANKFPDGPI
jgi:hypothetical protein